jgi:nucleoside-diphosphate-sugar epimerase
MLQDDAPAGVYNACDDTRMKMGDWLDLVADTAGLPRPPRVARAELAEVNDFMGESRRLDNTRLKQVAGVKLRYRTVHEGLAHANAVGVD